MSKVFIIPDVHLKPWMFKKADKLIEKGQFDEVVMLGDLVDDWGQENNKPLYNETFDAVIRFVRAHPNTRLCYGNHDLSYLWEKDETGYSYIMREIVVSRMKELEGSLKKGCAAIAHRIDDVVFCHGGITEGFVKKHFKDETADVNTIIERINNMTPDELWTNDSPIWARPWPICYDMMPYSEIKFQVVGHSPVYFKMLREMILIADTFSTFRNGEPLGDEVFLSIDTKTLAVEELNEPRKIKMRRSLW